MNPIAPLPHIDGIDNDLQLLGHYIQDEIKRLRSTLNGVVRQTHDVAVEPEEVELNAEQEAKAEDMSPAETRLHKLLATDFAIMKEEAQATLDNIELQKELFEQLKKRNYKEVADYLKNELGVIRKLRDQHTKSDDPDTYREREAMEARIRALEEYIKKLETRSAT